MNFRIWRVQPVYCPIHDGLIGSRAYALPMTYFVGALAARLASRMTQENYENCGDDQFVAIAVGKTPWMRNYQ